jgi:arylsulfatase A-like enzyme
LIAAKEKAKPLFLYVPFNGVHSPLQVPESYLQPYTALTGPRQKLAGMLSAVDEAIGQIVTALEGAGLRDNTLILFSADNGGPKPGDNTPLRGYKGSIYEGGLRGCAWAHWPGHIPSGVRSPEPVHIVDWYPTLVTLAGGSLDQKLPLDGRDIWPVLTAGAKSPHEAVLLCATNPSSAALRAGDWKLVHTTRGDELYNLAADLGESQDLAAAQPGKLAELRAKLDARLTDAVPPGGGIAAGGERKKPAKKRNQ